MEKLTYTNANGQSVELGYRPPYMLQQFSGAGDLDFDVQVSKAPFQDGATFLDTLADVRDMSFRIALLAENQLDLYERRRFLSTVFNPKLGKGELTYENDWLKKSIEVYLEGAPRYPTGTRNQKARYQNCLIQMTAVEPFWKDPMDMFSTLAAVMPLFEFELEIATETDGIEMSSHSEGRISIDNTGDVDAPLYFEFPGPVTNPRITNVTTGEFVELITPLDADETMIITTAFGNKTAMIVDSEGETQSAFQYLNLDSTFFQLVPGINELEFDAAAGSDEATITIIYRRRYVGL